MKKKAVISLKSFNDLDEDDIIEVVTPGEFLITEDDLRQYMNKMSYKE